MGDTKALTNGSGGFGDPNGDEDMGIPKGARHMGGWMTGWMGRLGARTQRRGSLGFTDGVNGTPPARMGSVEDMEDVQEQGRTLAKTRNDSYSNFLACTPGGDGDQYNFRQRFGRKNSESQDLCSHAEDMARTEVTSVTDLPGGHGQLLPTLKEGVAVTDKEGNTTYGHEDPLRGVICFDDKRTIHDTGIGKEDGGAEGDASNGGQGGDASIFLIDLEEAEPGADGKPQLKPKSKKFSAASLLGGKFTQNWFFRKNDDEYDNLVMDENQEADEDDKSNISFRESSGSTTSNESNDDTSRKTVMKKLKNLADKNGWREINFGAPQGT